MTLKIKTVKAIALILAMICILCFPVPASAISQGTDGTELQVMKPEKLEIRLGEDWAGVEFDLSTDAGKYPGVIVVGEDGVLRMEIGGSSSYILSCANSFDEIPDPSAMVPDETEESHPSNDGDKSVAARTDPIESSKDDVKLRIPNVLLMLGGGSLVLSIAILLLRRSKRYHEDDEF